MSSVKDESDWKSRAERSAAEFRARIDRPAEVPPYPAPFASPAEIAPGPAPPTRTVTSGQALSSAMPAPTPFKPDLGGAPRAAADPAGVGDPAPPVPRLRRRLGPAFGMPEDDPPAPQPASDVAVDLPALPEVAEAARTRLLGFQPDSGTLADPFDRQAADANLTVEFPTGWLILVEGPGRGTCYTLTEGVSQIGRGEDQTIRLDFGDHAISRKGHASIVYDDELQSFFLGHGGKLNPVRLNGRPVLATEELASGDRIQIGETTLLFLALCGPDFSWSKPKPKEKEANLP